MLDLYILRNKLLSVSPLQITICQDGANTPQSLSMFYTSGLNLNDNQATYVVTDTFLFFGKIRQVGTSMSLLLGPATEYPLDADAKTQIAEEIGFRGKRAAALGKALSATPIMTLTTFIQQISLLNYIINGSEEVLPAATIKRTVSFSPESTAAVAQSHNTYKLENYMLRCVEFGQVDKLKEVLSSSALSQGTTGIQSSGFLRAQKTLFIASAALASRAAVRGGLSYDVSLSVADEYSYRIEQAATFPEIQALLEQMFLDYASRTAQLWLPKDCSELVLAAVQQISGNLYQKIRTEDLAETLHVSRSYLSHQFKREMGISLTEYITRQKIQEAIRLMNTTNMKIAEIAYQLSFSSQSYFQTTFKKVTGKSPAKEMNRSSNTFSL